MPSRDAMNLAHREINEWRVTVRTVIGEMCFMADPKWRQVLKVPARSKAMREKQREVSSMVWHAD